MNDRSTQGLECVEPLVGDRILDLTLPGLRIDERQLLLAHAEVCALCQMTLDLDRHLAKSVRDGSIGRTPKASPRWSWTGWAAVVATAASLACVLVLGPRPVGPTIEARGPSEFRFIQPVEGEIVPGGTLHLAWTEIPGVESYQIRITDLGNGSSREKSTPMTELALGPDMVGDSRGAYRVMLSAVPADLVPPGGVSVTFRTGDQIGVLFHKLKWAQPVAYLLAIFGAVLGGLFVTGRRSRFRSEVSG